MFNISILAPHKKIVVDKPVAEVFIPSLDGEINILPGHAPLMAIMKTGVLRVRYEESTKFDEMAISWGYAQVGTEGVTILAETAESPEEIDVNRAKHSQEQSEKNLDSGDIDGDAIEKNMAKLERAIVRQAVAKSHQTH